RDPRAQRRRALIDEAAGGPDVRAADARRRELLHVRREEPGVKEARDGVDVLGADAVEDALDPRPREHALDLGELVRVGARRGGRDQERVDVAIRQLEVPGYLPPEPVERRLVEVAVLATVAAPR